MSSNYDSQLDPSFDSELLNTYLSAQHSQNLTALIAHNPVRLLVIKHRHSIPPLIIPLRLKIHILQMREALMPLNRIRNHILTGNVFLALLRKAPAALGKVPVHDGEADDVLEALELARNERAVSPRARVADIEVVAALLGRVLGAGFAGDGVAE